MARTFEKGRAIVKKKTQTIVSHPHVIADFAGMTFKTDSNVRLQQSLAHGPDLASADVLTPDLV
jgi:hypothetical protein